MSQNPFGEFLAGTTPSRVVNPFAEFIPRTLRGNPAPVKPDQTRTGTDPDAWQSAMRHPGLAEQGLGAMFDLAQGKLHPEIVSSLNNPVGTVYGMAESVVKDPAKIGMYAAKKLNQAVVLPAPSERFDVSGEEAAMAALNVAGILAASAKAGMPRAEARIPVEPEVPRGTRVPASQAAARLAQARMNRLGPAIPTAGDLPLNVSMPPATEAFPAGATFGSARKGGAPKLTKFAARTRRTMPINPEMLARPLPDEIGISTVDTRYAEELAARIKAANVEPTNAFPASAEAFPEGFSTTGKVRRTGQPTGMFDEFLPPERTVESPAVEPVVAPDLPPVQKIGEPVSVGRDLSAADTRKGVEPTFNTNTGPLADLSEGGTFGTVAPSKPIVSPGLQWREVPDPVKAPLPKVGAGSAPKTSAASAPDPVATPREFINYTRLGLDQTTEARLRNTVDEMRAGGFEKDYQSFAEQEAAAKEFKQKFLANPLDFDPAKFKGLSGFQVKALQRTIGENSQTEAGLSKALRSGELNPTETAEALKMLDAVNESTRKLMTTTVRETSQIARDLGFLRQDAKLSLDPDVWLVRAQRMMGENAVMPDGVMANIRKLAREATQICGGL